MNYEAVVIGASLGGLSVLRTILAELPANFPAPIMVVQHRSPESEDFFTLSLNSATPLSVKEASEKEPLKPSYVYLAPANYHLLVEWNKTLSLSIDPKVCYSRPAIDVLFETAAEVYQNRLIGLILTGANSDGTAGMEKIKQCGGLTLAQEPTTAESALMPQSAIDAGVIDHILIPADITAFLKKSFNYSS